MVYALCMLDNLGHRHPHRIFLDFSQQRPLRQSVCTLAYAYVVCLFVLLKGFLSRVLHQAGCKMANATDTQAEFNFKKYI